MTGKMEGVLFGLGNPLLDISAEVNTEFLNKYELRPNDAILADDKHKGLYDELCEKFNAEYVPGGATQNAIKIAQWMLGTPRACTFTGCIGQDKFGKILCAKTEEAGVNTVYQYTDKEQTGTCAVLITGKNRSLVAYLAAANLFTIDHLQRPENWALVTKAQFFYIGGFPLTVCPDAMLKIGKYSAENDRTFCMNLAAPFLCQFFKKPLMECMPYVDILFGNETEALAFSKEENWDTSDLAVIAKKFASFPKQNGKIGRIVVITHGAQPTVIVKEGIVKEYPVIPIKQEEIVDTNGAGDAFVGGFLAHLVQGDDMEACIRGANYAANLIIQRSGCTYPDDKCYTGGPAMF